MDYYSVMRNGHWNYATEIMPQGSTLEDHRLSEVSWMEKDNFAFRQNTKRDTKEQIYNKNSDSENLNTGRSSQKMWKSKDELGRQG